MRKTLIFAIGLVCLLIVQSNFITFVGAQVAENPQGDLWGQNMGDHIMFWWSNQAGSAEYIVYRAPSDAGPWQELARVREVAARTGGAKVDYTADAKVMDLCYKVEAIDANAMVIRFYEPMCIPKFVP
jgi:hypothetical protein